MKELEQALKSARLVKRLLGEWLENNDPDDVLCYFDVEDAERQLFEAIQSIQYALESND